MKAGPLLCTALALSASIVVASGAIEVAEELWSVDGATEVAEAAAVALLVAVVVGVPLELWWRR